MKAVSFAKPGFWRDQLVEAWYSFVVPGVAALMPWRLGWRWLRLWARRKSGPFNTAARTALAAARQYIPIPDEQAFVERMSLIWMIDYRDFFLSTLHRRMWTPRYVERVGNWPAQGPFIVMGFHFGAAYWLYQFLAQAGYDCTTVSTRFDWADHRARPVLYGFGRWRYRNMERISGRPIAYRPGVGPVLRQSLQDGVPILSLADLPPRMVPRGQHAVRLLGHDLSFPDGALELAQENGALVVPIWVEFDRDLYKRRFCIGEPLNPADKAGTLQKLADILDRQIQATPEGWTFWSELPSWISDAGRAGRK
jgi:hypothetical protein